MRRKEPTKNLKLLKATTGIRLKLGRPAEVPELIQLFERSSWLVKGLNRIRLRLKLLKNPTARRLGTIWRPVPSVGRTVKQRRNTCTLQSYTKQLGHSPPMRGL